MKRRTFKTVKSSEFKKPKAIQRPRCNLHDKEMVFKPAKLVWECPEPACKAVQGVDALGNASEPSMLKGAMEYLVFGEEEFIFFPDNNVLIPIASLPDDAVVSHRDNEVRITMSLTKRVVNQGG